MRRGSTFLAALLVLGTSRLAAAQDFTPRFTLAGQGGTRILGATLGHDCGSSVPAAGTAECLLRLNTSDSSPDAYYLDATASSAVLGPSARTSATFDLPAGATVEHARLYWGARRIASADNTVTLARTGGGSASIDAEEVWQQTATPQILNHTFYQATADVSAFVQAEGAGTYSVTGVDAVALPNVELGNTYAGWTLVVLYENVAESFAARTIYDGFVQVAGNAATTALTVQVPQSPFNHPARLALLAYEGDFETTGDSVAFGGTTLADACNPGDNFFNSSRCALGVPVTNGSDVPAFSGVPDSMASYDLDLVDISQLVSPGDSDTTVTFTSAGAEDLVLLGAMVTEFRGCVASADCQSAPSPACNPATGDCQACVPNGDPGICATSSDGPICKGGGGGTVFCGCNTDADCTGGEVCDPSSETCALPCTSDADCVDPSEPVCDPATNTCVECVTDADCTNPAQPHCDPGDHECKECYQDRHCDPDETCDPIDEACEPGGGGAGGAAAAGGSSAGGSSAAAGGSSASGADAGGASAGGAGAATGFTDILQGGGCGCRMGAAAPPALGWWLSAALAALAAARLRGKRRRTGATQHHCVRSRRSSGKGFAARSP